jgi:hypothetical protein
MPLPTRETGQEYQESDLVVKVEMTGKPGIPADHRDNLNTQVPLGLLQRLAEHVIGNVRISGYEVAYGGGLVSVAVGEFFTKWWYINKVISSSWSHVASPKVVYLRVEVDRTTFEDNPNTGIQVAGRGLLPGPSIYAATAEYFYEDSMPTDIAGTGADGSFTRTAGTWSVDELQGREVEFYTADGVLVGPFVVTTNTTTVATIVGNVTGATSIRTAHYVKLADVDAAGVVTNQITTLAGTIANLLHTQNSDTHTSEDEFYVVDEPGSGNEIRVLTTRDLGNVVEPPQDDPGTLEPILNFRAISRPPAAPPTGWHGSVAPAPPAVEVDWGIDGTGTYTPATDTMVVAGGHDGPALATDDLVDYIFQDSAGELYKITANTAAASPGDTFDITIAPSAGQNEPSNGVFTVRTNALMFMVTITPYDPTETTLDVGRRIEVVLNPDNNGALRTEALINPNLTYGELINVKIEAFNNAATPVQRTENTDIRYAEYDTTTINVDEATISVTQHVDLNIWHWDDPGAFDRDIHVYGFASTVDGVAPVHPDDEILRPWAAAKAIGSPGATNKISIVVRTITGRLLSDTPATAEAKILGQTFSDLCQVYPELTFTDLTTFSDPGDGSSFATVRSPVKFTRPIYICAFDIEITSLTGTSPVIKPRIFTVNTPQQTLSGSQITGVGSSFDTFILGENVSVGEFIEVGFELVSGTVTDLDGTFILHYSEINPIR